MTAEIDEKTELARKSLALLADAPKYQHEGDVEIVFHDRPKDLPPITIPLEALKPLYTKLERLARYYEPETDEHNIELTQDVKNARAAAETISEIMALSKRQDEVLLSCSDKTFAVPQAFLEFMREALWRLGEGFPGINVNPIIPPDYTQPVGPIPTHNLSGWETCPCVKCQMRRGEK